MIAFGALASGILTPLNNLVSTGMQLQMLEVFLARIADVMDTPLEQPPNAAVRGAELMGKIEFEDVHFKYPGQTSCVISGCSFQIESGTRVAIVGKSGSGKSTLARLIAGLYQPTEGRVLLDAVDAMTLDRNAVRQQLGIVTQDAPLFTGTIRHNIAIADPEMRLDEVKHAAEIAGIHEEIQAMPLGYETLLLDRGLSLSGGQRQRVAVARAVARRPRILILDEATSHLDSLTELHVNTNLSRLGCTRVVIAHRIVTVKDADLILVLENGSIVEQGTHDELLRLGGRYSAMVSAQPDVAVPAAQRGFPASLLRR
jgi:ABC-type bacteriocin/lantibiotic exporter with double-glycine peptidase domain